MHDLDALHPPPHPLLIELERRADDGAPTISRVTGRFLSTIVTAMQATRILEVGTKCGYSTLWMALAQPAVGRIWTIEPDVRRTDVARSYFGRAGEEDSIEVFNTPALELLENFPHRNLDIAFISSGTGEYERYLKLVFPMLKLSGLVIFDRVRGTSAEFREAFLHQPELDATILSLPGEIAIGARRQ